MGGTNQFLVVAAASYLLVLAAVGVIPEWIGAAAGVAAGLFALDRSFRLPARRAQRRLRVEMDEWRRALVGDRSALVSHDLITWVRRPLRETERMLSRRGEQSRAREVSSKLDACERLARIEEGTVRTADLGDATGGRVGLVPGFSLIAPTRSGNELRLFGAEQAMPRWLGENPRQVTTRLLAPVDLIRLLHSPEIEHRAVIATLWIRLLFLLAAPLTGAVSAGTVPLGPDSSLTNEIIYWVVCAESAVTAAFAGRIADHVVGHTVRWPLLALEFPLSLLLLATSPCWACAAFAAGPVVWFEKRDWSLVKLLIWGSFTFGVLLWGLSAEPAGAVIVELAISVVVISLIADSYGLMFPAVIATLATTWRFSRKATADLDRMRSETTDALTGALAMARRDLESLAPDPDAETRGILASIARAEVQIKEETRSNDVGGSLIEVCSKAISSAGIPPSSWNSDALLQATQIQANPRELAMLRPANRKVSREIESLLRRVALEAAAHGRGLFATRIANSSEGLQVTVANEIHPDRQSGLDTGISTFQKHLAGLPGARVYIDGEVEFEGMNMWRVRVVLPDSAFAST